jgi:glycosyltransferase involved in cell wall biosynthesis|tara:strand:+ start:2497 stop:3699 length:1203 start_codon:yes stop_codon:yes gene_type:complete
MPIKILQITNKPAYPSIDGGCLGMAKMSDFYSSNPDFDLDILTLETFKHSFNEQVFKNSIPGKAKVYYVKIDTKPNAFGAIKALISNKSYNLTRFKSIAFENKLKDLLKENNYDIIQLENIFVAQYIALIRKHSTAKIILNSANIEYEIWQRMSGKYSYVKNKYFGKLATQLKVEEEILWKQTDGIICATDKDKAMISEVVNSEKLITLPFYLNISKYKVVQEIGNPPSFFHIGAMDWLPNVEGIDWFLNSIWSKLKVDSVFNIAGKGMLARFKKLSSTNLVVSGFVDDALEFMENHDVMIVPLLSGSGIRVKIIEAMAIGKCVISTSIGAEGINCIDKKNILIADTEDEFITVIHSLISNPKTIMEIGVEARLLIENEHDISLMGSELSEFINQTLNIG